MKRNAYFHLSALVVLVFLPGCGRLIDFGKSKVPQGTNTKKDMKSVQNHIRSTRVYDQFTFLGSFDSLWLSDEVRSVYVELYGVRHGGTEEALKVVLRRQLEENNHFISFYVLTAIEMPLGETNSEWSVFLKIGERQIAPIELKAVDLSPEYVHIFGKKMNRFKAAYLVRFKAKDIEDQRIIDASTPSMSLVFKTMIKEVTQDWLLTSAGSLQPDQVPAKQEGRV
jgi:hypothetical protein